MPTRKNRKWIPCCSQLPDDGVVVDTRLMFEDGWHEDRQLMCMNHKWFTPSGNGPVKEPTKWKYKREPS